MEPIHRPHVSLDLPNACQDVPPFVSRHSDPSSINDPPLTLPDSPTFSFSQSTEPALYDTQDVVVELGVSQCKDLSGINPQDFPVSPPSSFSATLLLSRPTEPALYDSEDGILELLLLTAKI